MKNLKGVVLELLKHLDKCKINQVNNNGETALIWACCNNMKEVALELLKHPDECKIDQVTNNGNTALILAHKNNMTYVVNIIASNIDIIEVMQLS